MKTLYKKLIFLWLLLPFTALAQSPVSGTVTDKSAKQPLPGVNVLIQGSATGTQTDFDGNYKITAKNGDVILFSYLGYKNQTVTYTGQANVSVQLEEESNQLQEVVIQVGYGSVKKRDATGAVELVTAKDFTKGAITSVDQLLNGRASGVVITSSGTPGNDGVIRIRGGSSLLASNDPLIVVDGLPLDGISLSSINPNDIESFSILKDASSAAIYGNRASGGVILITTKKGSKKGISVNISSFTTMNTLARRVDVYKADEFRNLITEKAPGSIGELGTANTDWQDQIFHNSYTSDVSASILGNIKGVLPARLTIGNNNNNGILLTSEYTRTTASAALNPSFLDDHLKINANGNYSYTYRRNADEGAIGSALAMNPTRPVYDPSSIYAGYYEDINQTAVNTGYPRQNSTANPLALLMEKRSISNEKRFFGNVNLEYKLHFFPDLKVILNYGVDLKEGEGYDYTNPKSRSGFNSGISGPTTLEERQIGSYSTRNFNNRNENRSGQLFYEKAIGKFKVDALAGYEWQQFDSQNYNSANIFLYDLLETERLNADTYTDPGNNLQAYLGRVNVGFNDKYLLTFNFRRDGTTRVSPVNKWDNFYGAAFAWKIKDEFFKNSETVSDLKLRLSYGETGQQNIPYPYAWIKRYTVSGNAYYQFGNDFFAVARPEGYNENLKWERSRKSNIGLDFGFFNNRLRGNIDGYFGKTDDMFEYVQQGALQNLGIFGPRNIGNLESKGVDVGLIVDAIKKDDFNLSFNYNVTYNHLELTKLQTDNQSVGGLGLQVFTQTHKVGLAPYSFWVYEQIYDANGKPVEGAFVDRDGNGLIDSNDKYNYHKPQADVTMGLLSSANYKNLDFSMAWRASIGNYVYDQVSADRATIAGLVNAQSGAINNAPVTFEESEFLGTLGSIPVKESDYYVKDGSFVKLDNVTIGYNFRHLFNDVEKPTVRLSIGVQNVWTITKYKGLDPEVFNNGIDNSIFPRARMYMLGMNVNF